MANVDAIIIGAGPSGIAMAHKLKQKLGFEKFTVRLTDKVVGAVAHVPLDLRKAGRTWRNMEDKRVPWLVLKHSARTCDPRANFIS